MEKNTVRLTESQLHQVIQESVKQVLSELDWRTYANASKLAKNRGDNKLANRFINHLNMNSSAHKESYNDKYGNDYSVASIDIDKDGNAIPYGFHRDEWGDYDNIEGFGIDGHNRYKTTSTKYPGEEFGGTIDGTLKNSDLTNHYKNLERQAKLYNQGKSHYTKGKGWD